MRGFCCLAVIAGCGRPAPIAAKPSAAPAHPDRPAGILVFRTAREASADVAWLDLTSGARGTLPPNDHREAMHYERRGAGVVAIVERSVPSVPEDHVVGTFCLDEAKVRAPAQRCFVLPVTEDVGKVI